MAFSSQRSKKLYDTVTDILRNQGKSIEPSDGIIYYYLTTAQRKLMNHAEVVFITYELPLHKNQKKYYIHEFVGTISRIECNNSFNPYMELPSQSPNSPSRNIIIHNCDEIPSGTWLDMECTMRARESDVIDDDTDPLVSIEYDDLLIDYTLSNYRYLNESFRQPEQVIAEAIRRKNKIIGLNKSRLYRNYIGARL